MDFKEFSYQGQKPWEAKKEDIIQFWNNVKPNQPVVPKPISSLHEGKRFNCDGLRITGSPQFIGSVLSRLKDLLQYDMNPGTELDLEFKQVEAIKGMAAGQAYVFYAHVIEKKPDVGS